MTATTEFVVPRSIPIILLIATFLLCAAEIRCWLPARTTVDE
jgi:hypothetical protein